MQIQFFLPLSATFFLLKILHGIKQAERGLGHLMTPGHFDPREDTGNIP